MATIPHPDWLGLAEPPPPKAPRAPTLHDQLVARAARWLRTHGCRIVLTEMRCLTAEQPDAIGWKEYGSYLIECKTSRSDFAADKHKPFRQAGGMGNWRYFLTPPGLVTPDELPGGWGLLYANQRAVEVVHGHHPRHHDERKVSFRHEPELRAERTFLLSALRRLQLHHGDAEFDRLVHATYASKNQ